MAAPAAADASAMPRRSGVPTSEGDAAGGAIGSTDAGGASVYSKLLGAWWCTKKGVLRGCTKGVRSALHHALMHYGVRTENWRQPSWPECEP